MLVESIRSYLCRRESVETTAAFEKFAVVSRDVADVANESPKTCFPVKGYFKKTQLAAKFLVATLLLLLALAVSVKLRLWDSSHILHRYFYWLPESAALINGSQIPAHWRRFSTVNCSQTSHACHVEYLYWIDKEFHAYFGDHVDESSLPSNFFNQTAYTGIGFGSPIIHLTRAGDVNPNFTNLSSIAALKPMAKSKSWEIPLRIHFRDPPLSLPSSLKYYPYGTTAFFSVMWDNMFRTMYAGVSSWYTVASFGLAIGEDSVRMVLLDPQKPTSFTPLIEKLSQTPLEWLENHGDALFKNAVFGITRRVLLPEIEVEATTLDHHPLRNTVFRKFCQLLKSKVLNPPPLPATSEVRVDVPNLRANVTLILREGQTRRITNEGALIQALSKLEHVNLRVHRFANLSIAEQLAIVDSTDVLVAMHGAALTHTLFMRPGTSVLELFPWVFRKTIYQNLANAMGVYYQMWQNDREDKTVFHWDLVERTRFSNRTKDSIVSRPIDWRNMDSKNYWRNQDTELDIEAIVKQVRILASRVEGRQIVNSGAIARRAPQHLQQRSLLFQPWGTSLGEQLDGLKSACIMASVLNRTLVLPHLATYGGSKLMSNNDDEPGNLFKGYKMHWKPMERYFNIRSLERLLPCTISQHDNFLGMLLPSKDFGEVFYFGHGAIPWTSIEANLQHYYEQVLKSKVEVAERDPFLHLQSLHPQLILQRYASLQSARIIALGPLFPFSDFQALKANSSHASSHETTLSARVRHYKRHLKKRHQSDLEPAFMEIEQYSQVVSGLEPAYHLVKLARQISTVFFADRQLITLHVRRGARQSKCEYATSKLLDQDSSVAQTTELLLDNPSNAQSLDGMFVRSMFVGGSQTSGRVFNMRLKGQSARTAKACLQPLQHIVDKVEEILLQDESLSLDAKLSLHVITDSLGYAEGDAQQMKAVTEKVVAKLCSAKLASKSRENLAGRGKAGKSRSQHNCTIEIKLTFLADLLATGDMIEGGRLAVSNAGYGFDKIDSMELALLESLIAIQSDIFVGNLYSTFSHHVAEKRYLMKKVTLYF